MSVRKSEEWVTVAIVQNEVRVCGLVQCAALPKYIGTRTLMDGSTLYTLRKSRAIVSVHVQRSIAVCKQLRASDDTEFLI